MDTYWLTLEPQQKVPCITENCAQFASQCLVETDGKHVLKIITFVCDECYKAIDPEDAA